MATIPGEFLDFFRKRTVAHVGTLMPNHMPQVTPVWIDYDGETEHLLVNTAKGRQKHVNLKNDPRIGVSMTDPDNQYRALVIQGELDEMTEDGAAEHMDSLERRYRGNDAYPGDRSKRILLRIRPVQVWSWAEPPHYSVE